MMMARADFDLIFALRDRREALGVSVADVAHRMGISKKAVRKIESEKDPRLSTLRRYALSVNAGYQHTVHVFEFDGWGKP